MITQKQRNRAKYLYIYKASFKVVDLEDLPLYKEDWLGLASLDNQQKLHKVLKINITRMLQS